MEININRLMSDIEAYSQYGLGSNGGVTRPSFSEADYTVRDVFKTQLEEMGLEVTIDPIANIWGKLQGSRANNEAIIVGSHLDTVPNGGKFDGALGVLVAKEIVQTLIDHKVKLKHDLEIVSFTAEESNEFNYSTMGSRAFAGKFKEAELIDAVDSKGIKLSDAVKKAGGDISKIEKLPNKNIAAYLELHIEQGRKLEKEDLSIGIVDNIVGVYRDKVIVEGVANHSGTTIMEERQDALVAASEMVVSVQKHAKKVNSDAVATVGKLEVFPNATNVVPGRVEFMLEIRSANKIERELLIKDIQQSFKDISEAHNVKLSFINRLNHQECSFDKQLIEAMKDVAESLGHPYIVIPSMAGHDAMHMADITKAAMLFVKSANGISHNPKEFTDSEDIRKGANTLLQSLIKIDKELTLTEMHESSVDI
ncbi:M20 family metallo-hydrolase [Sporosarcina sp. G11-34]|uniref:M20 family metallo-hydrolase n=1 Tax=Sporosarcina sp. G11-34 TaxID=2849605 RepID=UPI0022A94520|nr:M20 family metallo-hydrolase [Sporosarcina sp. G11-34]MCZ2258564.1 M20 family metallo-hydrolase [Sporosarcina sp. G11-34]